MRVCLYAYMCACVCVEGMVVSMSSVCNHGKSELEGIAVKTERVTGRHQREVERVVKSRAHTASSSLSIYIEESREDHSLS